MPISSKSTIAFYTPNLKGGGAERMLLILAGALVERGYHVDLLLDHKKGAYVDRIPAGVNVRELPKTPISRGAWLLLRGCPRQRMFITQHILTSPKALGKLRVFSALVTYLRTCAPTAIICALGYTAFFALWARNSAAVPTRVVVREGNALSAKLTDAQVSRRKRRKRQRMQYLMARLYPRMDGLVAVSNGVAADLAATLAINRDLITTIYNPVISQASETLRRQPACHPWLTDGGPPVVLAVGRLNVQKDFALLLDAFATIRTKLDARLIIVGDGPQRGELEAKVRSLRLQTSVDMPGWADNPYAYMAHCSVFVLSSRYEGLPTVLIEAMACGCPVVATDCPSGPSEILHEGRIGGLVPMQDAPRLATAIVETIHNPPDVGPLRARAAEFSVERSTADYIALLTRHQNR